MYPHTENEAVSLKHSQLRAGILKNTKIYPKVEGHGQNAKNSPNYFQCYCDIFCASPSNFRPVIIIIIIIIIIINSFV